MKLTQRTIFQCFEKSRSKSIDPDSKSSTTVTSNLVQSTCKSENSNSSQSNVSNVEEKTFLLPIHVRQFDRFSPVQNRISSWKESHLDDESFINQNKEFFQRTKQIENETNDSKSIELVEIFSSEKKEELFEKYTREQTSIDWRSIYENLEEYRTKSIEQNQYEQLLWTEIYRPKSSKTFLGNQTKQIKRLKEWFNYWANKLQTESTGKLERIKRKRAFNDDEYDEDSNFSQSSSNFCKPEHPRLIFIHGSGTTSLVHALAEEFNFKVTEINGSQCRARTPLLKQLEQMTSHQLCFKRCPSDSNNSNHEEKSQIKEQIDCSSSKPLRKRLKTETNSIGSFFNETNVRRKSSLEKENHQEDQIKPVKRQRRSKNKIEPKNVENNFFSSVQVEKTSLILFDEIETLTDDEQFWSCLKKLNETAKKPIILTSNSRTNPEKAIVNLSKIGFYELIHLENLDSESIECFVRLVLLAENIEIVPDELLKTLIKSYSLDLRRILNELQFSARSSLKISEEKRNFSFDQSSEKKIHLEKSTFFDAMFYSRLDQRCTGSSSLKSQFDRLTESFLLNYEKSREIFMNSIENDRSRLELYDTFKLFMQEQNPINMIEDPSFYLDYRPFVREICRNEKRRHAENHQRFRHALHFRGCSKQM